jgi:hypothetical protein
MTSFWWGEGLGRRAFTVAVGASGLLALAATPDALGRKDLAQQAGQFAPLAVLFRCGGRPAPATSRCFRVSISMRSSSMVRAAVAWSRISSSAASTSTSGAVVEVLDIVGVQLRAGGNRAAPTSPPRCSSFQLAQPLSKALPAAAERLEDGLGRRGETPLQDGQGKANRTGALVVLQLPRPG